MATEKIFFAHQAWVADAWAYDVQLVAADGYWKSVKPGVTAGKDHQETTVLQGLVLPGLVNAHSHAFQRAIAGLTEHSAGQDDDFWSWRHRMYSVALRITPDQLEAIATQLYTELLAGGYTQVCEFHYLHNDEHGKPYADAMELSMALVRAAQTAGIGLTLLPALYMRSGFGAAGLGDDQRRFASTPSSVLRITQAINALGLPQVNAGVALHSLRAVDAGALAEVAQASQHGGWPVHLHISEQLQEVNDCIAHHDQRPIEWLLGQAQVDPHWNLVHATHATPSELHSLQATGAAIVICPSTEANLGDGVFDFQAWARLGGRWSIGSDSHVTRHALQELQLLEYSQRLTLRQRNVAARASGTDSSAAALLQGPIHSAVAASGVPLAGIAAGQRADLCMLAADAPSLAGIAPKRYLDAMVFSSPGAAVRSVVVAGKYQVVNTAQHQRQFTSAMKALWL